MCFGILRSKVVWEYLGENPQWQCGGQLQFFACSDCGEGCALYSGASACAFCAAGTFSINSGVMHWSMLGTDFNYREYL